MSLEQHATITRLRVKNYRSLADVDIELGPLTVLVGRNGSGKSNVVDALRFVRDAYRRDLDSAILNRNGMSAIRRWSAKGVPYDVQIQLDIAGPGWLGEYGFTLGSRRRGEYQVKWERVSITQESDDAETSKHSTIEIKNGQVTKISEDIKRYAEFLVFSTDLSPLIISRIRTLGPFIWLCKFLGEFGFYTIYPDAIRMPQNPANPYPLDESGENLASVLRDMKKRPLAQLQEMLETFNRVVEGVTDYSVQQVGGYLVTRLHHTPLEGQDRSPTFPLAQESDGTLRMLGLLTALYQTPHRSFITIEEPELTIHPGALSVLCDALQEASLQSQVLVTTHSPELISHFPADVFRVVEKVNGVTKVGPIKESQREAIRDKLFSPGELMVIEGLQREADSPKEE